MAKESGVKKEFAYGKLVVDSVTKGQYQKKGTLTAQLRQVVTVTSTYPSTSIGNNFADSLYDENEFDAAEGSSYTNEETRITWLDVPATAKTTKKQAGKDVEVEVPNTKELVEKRLAKFPNAVIYKVMSNRPILTDGQLASIEKQLKTMEDYAEKQVCRYGANSDQAGDLILDANGKVQYKRNFFSQTAKEDEDLRTEDFDDQFLTEEMELEMEASENQTLE